MNDLFNKIVELTKSSELTELPKELNFLKKIEHTENSIIVYFDEIIEDEDIIEEKRYVFNRKDVWGIYDFLNKIKRKTSRKHNIQETIDNIKSLGYEAYCSQISSNNSVYIEVSDKNETLFIIRMSDHNLTYFNQLPAGVINLDKYDLDYPISKECVEIELETYNAMSAEEKKFLWTNRDLTYEPDFPKRLIIL